MRNLLVLFLLLLFAAAPAHADSHGGGDSGGNSGGNSDGGSGGERGSHESDSREDGARARAALRAGEIRPLAELMAMVEARYAGRVIATHLERDHGRWTYELRLLPPSGRMFELRVDAATGKVVSTRGPVRERGGG
ncbi:MAG: hypothetical protein BGP12_02075 [Rhodospirillales bacterium 70-18]|nr:PepSY domain-containing protein [Rhodospirillales bacterium]OJY76293.1 MAG: hypothetical protein BGP12_02075 [Rhodospirillales bacterium 70-18]